MVKVLLVGDYPPPHGGVAVHVRQLHDFLRERGVEARVLRLGRAAREGAPAVIPARTPPRLVAEVARHAAAGWIVHLHTSGNNAKSWAVVAATAAAASPFGEGRLVTLHSGLSPSFLTGSAARRLFARAALAGFTRVIAVSPAVRAALQGCGVEEGRCTVCPAFLSSQVRPGPAPARFEEARRRRAPLLAMATHPSPVYGAELMARSLRLASARFPDIGLAVFGPGPREERFLRAARRERVEGLIEDFGELDHPSALALIRGCDAFVRPTSADGDSVSVREALALGVPCVASDVVERPAGAFRFRAGDPEDLVGRLQDALFSPRLRVLSPDAGPVVIRLYQRLRGDPRAPAPRRPGRLEATS